MASHPSPSPTDSMGRSRLAPVSSSLMSNGELDMFPDSAYSSPLSPASPADQTRESCKDSEDNATGLSDLDPASGPQRTRSAGHSTAATAGPSEPKEKRKRSRVTPEQLAHLERLFATDRSPTAARRKEISEMLGMQERQTQIWFQNRRAKAKLQESRREHGDVDHPSDYIPSLVAGSDAELYYLVHEDEPISVIPCIELAIGTWKRVISGPGKFDLVAYACEAQKRLTWYIRSGGQGFKMEVPFASIIDTKFANTATPGMGQASFVLSHPPAFFLEHVMAAPDPVLGTAAVRTWKRCSDWTEDMQATTVLQHDLVGAAVQLAHVLRNIAAYTAGPSIPLYPPAYQPPPLGADHPNPPSALAMAGLAAQSPDGALPGPAAPASLPHLGYTDYGLRRRFSTPALIQPHSIRHFPTAGTGGGSGGVYPANAYAAGGGVEVQGGGPGMSPSSTYSELSSLSGTSPSRHTHPGVGSVGPDGGDFPRLPIAQTISSRRSFAGPSSSPASFGDLRTAGMGAGVGGTGRPYSSGSMPSSSAASSPSMFAQPGARSPFLLRRASSTTWPGEPAPPPPHSAAGPFALPFDVNGAHGGGVVVPGSMDQFDPPYPPPTPHASGRGDFSYQPQ